MVFTKATEYALKSLSCMVNQPEKDFFGVKEIAETLQVSSSYLAKILQKLTRSGVLRSITGPGGGFGLLEDSGMIPISRILEIMDDSDFRERCMLGWSECGDANPCPFHDIWKTTRHSLLDRLNSLYVKDLSDNIWPLFGKSIE